MSTSELCHVISRLQGREGGESLDEGADEMTKKAAADGACRANCEEWAKYKSRAKMLWRVGWVSCTKVFILEQASPTVKQYVCIAIWTSSLHFLSLFYENKSLF